MASVAYLLFMSGILTGEQGQGLFTSNLFPNFTHPVIPTGQLLTVPMILQIRPVSVADVGKLFVWCFLAGYSERFVTGNSQHTGAKRSHRQGLAQWAKEC